jgi:YdaS antitoxin of YdaST toxin-antitoxin system
MSLTPTSAIDALGGTGAVAEALGVPNNTVSTWRIRGIPARRWPSLVRLAAEKGNDEITFEALASLANGEVRDGPTTQ